MATPNEHAKASASASSRWLNCTMAPTFEAQFPDSDPGPYAKEGTLAHKICELIVTYNAGGITKRQLNAKLKKCKEDPFFQEEMMKTADIYQHFVWEKATSFSSKPYQAQEVRVDFSSYVPGGFGTCDALIIGDDRLCIVDYKHGKGVPVSAENNSQMRLYALGALAQYGILYPVKTVSMAIVQPRITEDISEETITVEELLAWGEQIKPIAEKAATGIGAEFHEGSWCRFCKGKAVCRARAENMTALDDFKVLPIEGQLTAEMKAERAAVEGAGFPVTHALTDAEIGELLFRGEQLVSWYNDLKDYALGTILNGGTIPGWKVVAGKSNRTFDDTEAALEAIRGAGYTEEQLYERKPKTLTELEKLLGKKRFAEVAGSHVVKPMGKPALVDASDKREPYSPAAADFSNVQQGAT